MCDGQLHCSDFSDEDICKYRGQFILDPKQPPAVINFIPKSKFRGLGYTITKVLTAGQGSSICPQTHFQCPEGGYCLPVFTRCNQVMDCPLGQDEEACDNFLCPGFFRCRGTTKVCVHMNYVCDGIFQCPQHDDELVCKFQCPHNCTCNGLSFACRHVFLTMEFPYLKYLDASQTNMSLGLLANNTMLVYLRLAKCDMTSVNNVSLPNLQFLDLSDNAITSIDGVVLQSWQNLHTLWLAGNPLQTNMFTGVSDTYSHTVTTLDLSRLHLDVFNVRFLALFKNIQSLNLSSSSIRTLSAPLTPLRQLRVLDVRRCPIVTYPRDVLKDLASLRELYSDVFSLCCPDILPNGFNAKDCIAPLHVISSCGNIVSWDTGRILLSVIAIVSSVGNILQITHLRQSSSTSRQDAVLIHLTVSDFLMSVFLSIIGVTDLQHKGEYFWYDVTWRHCATCKLSGFLSFVSSTVSPMIITVVTLQCCVSLYCGSVSRTCSARVTHMTCVTAWLVGVVLATVPLLPAASHWRLYSQSALCLPTPVSTTHSAGQDYVVAVLVVLRLTLAMMMCVIHILTYHRFVNYSITADDPVGTAPALSRARRLFWMTLCHCLFLLSFAAMEILASRRNTITLQVRAAITIVLLPCGAAMDPLLYVFGISREHRRNEINERIQSLLKSAIASKRLQIHNDRSL